MTARSGVAAGATSWVVGITGSSHPAQAKSTTVAAPASTSAAGASATSILVSWTAPSSGATPSGYTITRNGRPVAVVLPVDDLESLEETVFWLEREIARLRAGEPSADGPDISGEEMAAIMDRRRREAGLA